MRPRVRYYDFEEFRFDVDNQQLFKHGEPVSLTQKTTELLLFLIRNKGKTITKQEFFESVWAESFVDETNLTQHIYRIRKTLGKGAEGSIFIETIPKLGYKFNAIVNEVCVEETAETPVGQNEENDQDRTQNSINNKDPVTPIQGKKDDSSFSTFSRKRMLLGIALLAQTILLFSLAYYFYRPQVIEESEISVAVLPFRQIGGVKDEKVQLGIADTLISNLGNIDGLTVSSTNSIVPYLENRTEPRNTNLFKIGKKLQVDILITGTIQRQENVIRVNLQFFHVRKERQFCTAKFDDEVSDAFTLQDIVAEKATKKLVDEIEKHVKLGDGF
jgi:DNA-binding winged helix-turn-helix (wHTH) protein/TolB-like protein